MAAMKKDTDKPESWVNKTCSVGGLTGESRVGVAERWCTRRCQPGRDVELEIGASRCMHTHTHSLSLSLTLTLSLSLSLSLSHLSFTVKNSLFSEEIGKKESVKK